MAQGLCTTELGLEEELYIIDLSFEKNSYSNKMIKNPRETIAEYHKHLRLIIINTPLLFRAVKVSRKAEKKLLQISDQIGSKEHTQNET